MALTMRLRLVPRRTPGRPARAARREQGRRLISVTHFLTEPQAHLRERNTGSVPALSSPSRRIHVRPQPPLANDFVIHGINFYCALVEEIDDCGLDIGGASAVSMLSKTASRMTSCAGAMRSRQITS